MTSAAPTTEPHRRLSNLSRTWFALTALAALCGIVLGVIMAAGATDTPAATHFHSPLARALNDFAFFTYQSNIIVGVTCLLLALRLQRTSWVFKMFRLSGVAAIIITGVVYHLLLAGLVELHSWEIVSNQLLHTVVPLLGVLGWLLFGPRRLVSWGVVGLAFAWPLAWVGFTLVRGALIGWYPYPFIDVATYGNARVAVAVLAITAVYALLVAGAMGLDRVLARNRQSSANDPVANAAPRR